MREGASHLGRERERETARDSKKDSKRAQQVACLPSSALLEYPQSKTASLPPSLLAPPIPHHATSASQSSLANRSGGLHRSLHLKCLHKPAKYCLLSFQRLFLPPLRRAWNKAASNSDCLPLRLSLCLI